MKISINKLKETLNHLYSVSHDPIRKKAYEEHYNKSIAELIEIYEKQLFLYNHSVAHMTITDLRNFIKEANTLPDSEKKVYLSCNPNCDFDTILKIAQRKVYEYDADKKNRKIRGEIRHIEDTLRRQERSAAIAKDMDKRGLGKYDSETHSFSSDLFTMLQYKGNYGDVYARILHEFKEKPRNVHTMPETGFKEMWFFVSSDGNHIIISQSSKKDSLKIPASFTLNASLITQMMDLYKQLKPKYSNPLTEEPNLETNCWLGILKLLRISAK